MDGHQPKSMNYVRYRLQPYSGPNSRYRCPACKHRAKTFKRYIHPDTGHELAPHVGLCDRVLKCGYHVTPRQYFAQQGTSQSYQPKHYSPNRTRKAIVQPPSYIDVNQVNHTLERYEHNNFVLYLINKLGVDMAYELVKLYRIGTSTRWPGATVFWQIDIEGNVRTGKIMLYNRHTGKRVKKPYSHVRWAHGFKERLADADEQFPTDIKTNLAENCVPQTVNYNLRQCLFGEHQLIDNDNLPVAIVESEKTAIISSAYMPDFIWLATGGLDGLEAARCKTLQNRKVILFPDANGYAKWQLKASQLRKAMPGTVIKVSLELEHLSSQKDKEQGIDLGDVLIR